MNAVTTGSEKIDRLVRRAEELGLVVEVEQTEEQWISDIVRREVTVRIRRQEAPVENMYDQVRQAEVITLAWAWNVGVGKTPVLYYSKRSALFGDGIEITANRITYWIDEMGTN